MEDNKIAKKLENVLFGPERRWQCRAPHDHAYHRKLYFWECDEDNDLEVDPMDSQACRDVKEGASS